MNREELMKKLELARVGNGTQTYNDVVLTLSKEETLDLLKYIEQLEKELKQTKLNFRNSQTHSKNCYKKLKEKFKKLERAYKNNEVLVRDLNELINRNLELKKDYDLLDEDYDQLFAKFLERKNENEKLKHAIKVLKEKGLIFTSGESGREDCICLCDYGYGVSLTQEEYELLKEVFESDR